MITPLLTAYGLVSTGNALAQTRHPSNEKLATSAVSGTGGWAKSSERDLFGFDSPTCRKAGHAMPHNVPPGAKELEAFCRKSIDLKTRILRHASRLDRARPRQIVSRDRAKESPPGTFKRSSVRTTFQKTVLDHGARKSKCVMPRSNSGQMSPENISKGLNRPSKLCCNFCRALWTVCLAALRSERSERGWSQLPSKRVKPTTTHPDRERNTPDTCQHDLQLREQLTPL